MAEVVLEKANLTKIENNLKSIETEINQQTNAINKVSDDVKNVSNELCQLKDEFEKMINEQRKTAALQQATTELVRVRQELEQEYGNYRVVRETMLGVLQATDSALVREKTIARVSEELMLSTPKYWLAPVLVAVSAWISNDRDLAERAIREAVRRDEEQTALTMALICRRNRRVDTCYEWLAIYFSKQKPEAFSNINYRIVDAYINGVFGVDEKHLCDEYMNSWIERIKGNSSNFEQEQVKVWSDYCTRYTVDTDEEYTDMKDCVKEYDNIKQYVSRISSVDIITDDFRRITDAYVDEERLREDVDRTLIDLISRYDKDEENLRQEEKRQQAIKDFNGDVEAANKMLVDEENADYNKRVDLIKQMTNTIASGRECRPSEKKTAISFLRKYIKKGFNKYITENREAFPYEITVSVDGWSGVTQYDPNRADNKYHEQEMLYAYTQMMENERAQRLAVASKDNSNIFLIGGIIAAITAIIGLFAFIPLGIILAIVAAVCFVKIPISKKKRDQNVANINMEYNNKIREGQAKISRTVSQWNDAREKVVLFDNNPTRNIIA